MKRGEIHVELLLGRRVCDSEGASLGRIEEIHAEAAGDDLVIKEYVTGSRGLLERLATLPLCLRLLPFLRQRAFGHVYRIPWQKFDARDFEHLRTTCTAHQLEHDTPERLPKSAGRTRLSKRRR